MIDKENAIKALEKAWNYLDVQKRTFKSVVMRNNGVLDGVHVFDEILDGIKDAITLLKAQEPRVMTLEEYMVWADIPFCERDPIFHEMKLRRGPVTWWTNTAECSIENYGKTERCWTARPDKATREETPWD